jgi:pectate lyase
VKTILLLGGVFIVGLFCSVLPASAADGFGGSATGGAGGTPVTVSTPSQFLYYANTVGTAPYIVKVSGTLDLSLVGGEIKIQSNKTISGIGLRPTIKGKLGFVDNSSNIIIEKLFITNPYAGDPYDGISVKSDITNLFITHCTIYDCGDGCLDITNGSDYITVSWCKFYYNSPAPVEDHRFVNLIGSTDDPNAEGDRGKLHITMHHNWWSSRCNQRMPRVRFGQVHIYNNYYGNFNRGNSNCAGVGNECQIRLENNYFDNVRRPWEDYYSGTGIRGKIGWNDNVFINTTIPTWATNDYATIFTPSSSYSYTLDAAADVKSIVMTGAGAPLCYGDFDHRGETLNFNDFAQFAEYWLDTNDIADADYYTDGIVNLLDFTLLAQYWRRTDFIIPSAPTGLSATSGDSIVWLDWSDNSEGDLAGYNIYRSTTFGSGYVKLNTSLLSDSNYVDNAVTNNTIYYYVVTAVDTSPLESIYSSQVSAIPLDPGNIIIQENTTGFCDVNGVVDSIYANYSGSGYAKTFMSVGSGINWRINVPSTGTYTLKWRHSHGTGIRNAKLLINSVEVSSISFPATGDGSIWNYLSVDVSLTSGINNIRLKSATGNYSGLPLIDYMMVTGDDPQPESCP